MKIYKATEPRTRLMNIFEGEDAFRIWLRSPDRREYKSIKFDASKDPYEYVEADGSKHVNLWEGLQVEPSSSIGDCTIIKDHFREVVCGGNDEDYIHLTNLLATWVQKPWEKTICPVFISSQGAGKGVLSALMRAIFGRAFLSTSHHQDVFGNFNSIIQDKILVELNEAMFGGHKGLAGTLKAFITDDEITINQKGTRQFTIKNQKKFFINSNESFAIPTGAESRRFCFFDVSDHKIPDRQYFRELYTGVNDPIIVAAFLDYLLSIDLSGFDHLESPQKDSMTAFRNKLQGEGSFAEYLYASLEQGLFDVTGEIGGEGSDWCNVGYFTATIRKCYLAYCKKEAVREVTHEAEAGKIMKGIFGDCKKQRRPSRKYYYELGTLEEAQEKFAKYFKISAEKIF